MKNFYCFLILILTICSLPISAHSKTFYVNASTGNNSNTSVQAQNISTPWLTVQYAIDNIDVLNGDNIVVANGAYAGFTLSKRLTIIGAWKGSNPTVNTVFNSVVFLVAPGGNSAERMVLKNLRVDGSGENGVDIRSSYVTLENVFVTNSVLSAVILNQNNLQDILIESCNLNTNNYSGIYFPSFASVNGFTLKNTTVNTNGYFGIAAFQRRDNPTEIKNVLITHCSFVNNNSANQVQGHTLYFEKLKNSVFDNISVVMPQGNIRIGININLLSRTDYSNISILNSRVIRSTEGSGIWVQARNDLLDPPALLDTVLIRGVVFSNCDTNIAFNRHINNMTVDKCDLSNYTRYALVNYTDQGGTINANNNKWKNGDTPDTTVLSSGFLVSSSNTITLMPSTDGIFVGMGIAGTGILPGTTVLSKTANSITMSSNATTTGISSPIGFAFNFATSTDLLRTALNYITTANPLPNAIVNQANVSFADLSSAIFGTSDGGTVYNLPSGLISGVTRIGKKLKLIGPGSGFLHSGSLTTFEILFVETDSFKMGSDFAVSSSLNNSIGGSSYVNESSSGQSGTTIIGDDNTLLLQGPLNAATKFIGGEKSDISFGGTVTTGLPAVKNGLRTLHINRTNGINLLDSLRIHKLLFLQNGIISLGAKNMTLDNNATIFSPFTATSHISTNGSGELRKDFTQSSPTFFNFTIGAGAYTPANVIFLKWTLNNTAYIGARVVNNKSSYNGCLSDYLNRYWIVNQNGFDSLSAGMSFSYVDGDVVGNEAAILGARFDGYLWNTYGPVNAAQNNFTTANLNSFGEFSGGGAGCLNSLFTEINTKVFLEGAYIGSSNMRTSLNTFGLIPLRQPYATPQYNYNGTEIVSSIPAGVVDWVYLELRVTESGAPVANGRRAAFVKADGSVVDLDGFSHVKLPGLPPGNYYIVIGHRIHLPVMSTGLEALSTVSSPYDFTNSLSKYYGGDAKSLGDGNYGMYGGDANRTFIVTAADYPVVTNNLLQQDYNFGDLNLNGTVTSADYFYITSNLAKSSNVPNYP